MVLTGLGFYLGLLVQWSPEECSQTFPSSPLDFLLLLAHCLCEIMYKVETSEKFKGGWGITATNV